jgi:hypothetical protein
MTGGRTFHKSRSAKAMALYEENGLNQHQKTNHERRTT